MPISISFPNKSFGKCKTKNYRLSGGEFESEQEFNNAFQKFTENGKKEGLPDRKTKEWFFRYGTNTGKV